jgi:hypothetical protein
MEHRGSPRRPAAFGNITSANQRRSDLRRKLERSGFRYQILMGDHVLLSGNGSGVKLALAEIVDFVNRSLVR